MARSNQRSAAPVVHVIENKREKFRRLGNSRAKSLIKRMRLMGNLGSKEYEASPEEIERLIGAFSAEFEAMTVRLRRRAQSDDIPDLL